MVCPPSSGCRRRRKRSPPDNVGHQNPTAQSGTVCQIESRLIQISAVAQVARPEDKVLLRPFELRMVIPGCHDIAPGLFVVGRRRPARRFEQ
jgi:hypothetical protein